MNTFHPIDVIRAPIGAGRLAGASRMLALSFLLFVLWLPASALASPHLDATSPAPPTPIALPAGLEEQAESLGAARVLVELALGEPFAADAAGAAPAVDFRDEAQEAAYVAAIAAAQDALMAELAGTQATAVRRYQTLPLLGLEVGTDALYRLPTLASVQNIWADEWLEPALADSVPLVRADDAWSLGVTGAGKTIAILDTGVDKSHSMLSGKVVSEACFSTTFGHFSTLCPNGQEEQLGLNAGVPCSIFGCDHGTHVAGIAAGRSSSLRGVAPDANVIAIQVFSRVDDSAIFGRTCSNGGDPTPCVRTSLLDYIAGLDRVFALRNSFSIASANMSLGGGRNTSTCDLEPTKLAIDNLRSVGILTVIAASNSSFRNAISAPACISTAVSVGATSKTDVVSSFSNAASFMTLWAPGESIQSAIPGNALARKNGTSMAAPHVAGAIAAIREAGPLLSADQIVTALRTTGPSITDRRSSGSVTKRRLDVIAALRSLGFNDLDDLRTLTFGATLNGAISPAGERDSYNFRASAGQKVTIVVERTSGDLNGFLRLIRPGGQLLVSDDDSGSSNNPVLNLVEVPDNGTYRVEVLASAAAPNTTGGYRISFSAIGAARNPEPTLLSMSPASATAPGLGSLVVLSGRNFSSTSVGRWDGSSRPTIFLNGSRLMMTVFPTDQFFAGSFPVTVFSPGPGGGTSQALNFTMRPLIVGQPEVTPTAGTSQPGDTVAFDITWTVPESAVWRSLNTLDFRLVDADTESPLWVQFVEREGTNSFLNLRNGAGEVLASGQPGAESPGELEGDYVTLILADTTLTTSGPTGKTVQLHLVVRFNADAPRGDYVIEVTASNDAGELQAPTQVGTWTIPRLNTYLPLVTGEGS